MWYIILGFFAIGGVSVFVEHIRESIENNAIKKSRVKEEIIEKSNNIRVNIESQIEQTKTDISSLQEYAFQQLPGLEDRLQKDARRLDYIRRVLPYKKKRN